MQRLAATPFGLVRNARQSTKRFANVCMGVHRAGREGTVAWDVASDISQRETMAHWFTFGSGKVMQFIALVQHVRCKNAR